MNMKKILFLLMALALLPAVARADDAAQQLVVWLKNGQKTYFDLSEQPRTSFSGGLLVIKTNAMETSYQRSNILRYTYEGISTGIEKVTKQKNMTVGQTSDGAILRNVPKDTVVKLYDVNGLLLETRTSDGRSPITISFARRHAGVYIVNVNEQSFKFWKR